MKALLILTCCILLSMISYGQDKIYKKDKSIIICKVVEIGIDEIKYKVTDEEMEDSPVISIAVSDVLKVVLSSGREIEFKNPLTNPASYIDDKKHAIKFHFISPLTGHLGLSYEKSIRPGRSFESEIGIIGVGFNVDDYESSSGVFIATGLKFLKTPDFYTQQFKYAHILKGGYVKPQLLLSIYRNELHDYGFNIQKIEQDIVAGALIINLGKQVVFDNIFLIDYSAGFGYGFSNQKWDTDDLSRFRSYHYGFVLGTNDIPVAVSARLKIGVLIK